jgi:hypothetical protein
LTIPYPGAHAVGVSLAAKSRRDEVEFAAQGAHRHASIWKEEVTLPDRIRRGGTE